MDWELVERFRAPGPSLVDEINQERERLGTLIGHPLSDEEWATVGYGRDGIHLLGCGWGYNALNDGTVEFWRRADTPSTLLANEVLRLAELHQSGASYYATLIPLARTVLDRYPEEADAS